MELLRQRLTNPNLEFKLKKIDPADVYEHDDGLFLRVVLKFEIQNVGRVAAYEWQLSVRQISRENQEISHARLEADYRFANFPEKKGQGLSLISRPLTRTILPGCTFIESQAFGCQLRPKANTDDAVRKEIEAMLAATIFHYQLATETSPGELIPVPLKPVLDVDALASAARQKCSEFFRIE